VIEWGGMKTPRQRAWTRVWLFACAAALCGMAWAAANEIRESRAFANEKLALAGVPNAGRVNGRLYRGGQPTAEGFQSLGRLGVNIVASFTLRTDAAAVAAEQRAVEALGMRFVALPWSSTTTPSMETVAGFLRVVRENPEARIFVHCKAGSDRTGVMVAVYRIAVDHWTTAGAIAEMQAFHYHFLFKPHLEGFVERLPATLPTLAAFAPRPSSSGTFDGPVE
jgi:protein tyrosine phosphatase (PTP) superfamily phosphohydrolase (DUF442 family)